jgi:hypothetical protein
MGSENAHGWAQNAENGFGFDFLERHHRDGDEFLNHIATGDETWVTFVNVETKKQSKQWMYAHSPNKPKTNVACQKPLGTLFWDRNGVLMVECMQQGTTMSSEMYFETIKNCVKPFGTNSVEC